MNTEQQNANMEKFAKLKAGRNFVKRRRKSGWTFSCRHCVQQFTVEDHHVKSDPDCFDKCLRVMAMHIGSVHAAAKPDGADDRFAWFDQFQAVNFVKFKRGLSWFFKCNICHNKTFEVSEGNVIHDDKVIHKLKEAMRRHIAEHKQKGFVV